MSNNEILKSRKLIQIITTTLSENLFSKFPLNTICKNKNNFLTHDLNDSKRVSVILSQTD